MNEALRKRLLEDMQLAGLAESTQKNYLAAAEQLGKHFRKSPECLSERQLESYIRYLLEEKKVARGTFQNQFHALRFLYLNTLAVDWHLFVKKKSRCRFKNACRKPGPMRNVVI